MDILKDILIAAGRIDRFYGDKVPVNLWRARNLCKKNVGLFELVEVDQKRNGGVRRADIIIENGWVKVKYSARGISTFDKPDVFKRGSWDYYQIPAGTQLPNGLVLVRDGFNTSLDATHYTIAPAHDMPLSVFKRLLNELAIQLSRKTA